MKQLEKKSFFQTLKSFFVKSQDNNLPEIKSQDNDPPEVKSQDNDLPKIQGLKRRLKNLKSSDQQYLNFLIENDLPKIEDEKARKDAIDLVVQSPAMSLENIKVFKEEKNNMASLEALAEKWDSESGDKKFSNHIGESWSRKINEIQSAREKEYDQKQKDSKQTEEKRLVAKIKSGISKIIGYFLPSAKSNSRVEKKDKLTVSSKGGHETTIDPKVGGKATDLMKEVQKQPNGQPVEVKEQKTQKGRRLG